MAALWKSAALENADADMLASLCAAQVVLRKFVAAGPAIMDEWLQAKIERDGARAAKPAPEQPEREEPPESDQPSRNRARLHAPQILAITMRATEMLVELAHIVYELKVKLIHQGIDPGPIEANYAATVIARVFKDELKIDLDDLAHCNVNSMFDALAKVRSWMDEARKMLPPKATPPPAPAGPQATKADPPPEQNQAARVEFKMLSEQSRQILREIMKSK